MKIRMGKLLIYGLGYFYLAAGMNHFLNPDFYIPLIPPFFPKPDWITFISGLLEIVVGVGVFFTRYRKIAAWGIILLLICFLPSHIYFIQQGSCIGGGLCVPEWVGWVRLVLVHPLLILWPYWVQKNVFLPNS